MTVDFNDYFWGDKNNGFDVLYHNMKYGLVASKELSDFFREKSNIEEHNSKLMTKLANKAGSGCVNGTFAPIWVVLKSSADRLASLHLQMVQKISELVKDVAKYADELHKKHKTVKEEESSTLEVVQAMQSSTVAVQKSKDLYNSKMLEFEKLKKDNASTKDLEKAETKLKKQQDDYKALLEKHNPVKMEFERRMNITCKKFQDIEDSHLKQMKEFLSTYIELLQNNHDMVGQVHSEFKRQFLEMTVDKLLEQFVLSKYTGLEKPGSRESRGSRDSSSIEVLSAPTSPSDHNQTNSQIGRNPLRGSKFSAILRSGRNKAKVKKANKKKKDGVETSSTKDEKTSVAEEVTEENKVEETPVVSLKSSTPLAPTATPDVDEDGYSIQPKEPQWETVASKKEIFYSDSDSDSEHDEQERKIRVEIKPLNNGIAPISASVDELRATVESLSLSPLGGALSQHQSPGASNASTPTASHPYAPLQSPTLSVSNTSRYADLGDIFSEVGEISASAPASANLSKSGRQIPTPTSANSIAIPRPPSRREAAVRGRVSPSTISRADSVGSLEFRTASIGIGSSRGPSPLTIGMSDTVPLAVAFHEIVHAYFKGSDESRCQVKMSGDMMLSFPAGIVSVLANNPNPAKLGFRIKNTQNLENVLPNKQLVTIDQLQSTSLSTVLEFNMPALTSLLRRQSEQNPTASYFNVDILKYQVKSKSGALSCPFQLVCYWKCEPTHTDIKIDYKYNSHAMAAPSPLLNVSISVPVDGGVKNVQSKPFSAWLGESNRLVWNFTDISQHSDNNGVGTLRARLDVANGPSNPSMLTTQFNCEGTTLSGIEFELVGAGYRLSLVKRRFVSGKYICEGDGIRNMTTPTPPSSSSPSPYNRTG
ncbi:F-BAR domain only protein 2 isoform X11 [Bradysia coprophila]|uniref:F-BAR domain only protein 2 isoform X11 n=1 Tax=Bradysia coprophila TaxID=38358 RepID=UPI00187D8766|nr:F-BAR domain only protein 2 isoform X11 [Bradysia coprophila]XP_037040946.1 F-BAR domain only protein 2 isoform X11 [Bradysia coprophila]